MVSSNQMRSNDSMKDTSFNIGTNDVTVDIKVDPDEFSLEEEKKIEYLRRDTWNSSVRKQAVDEKSESQDSKSYKSGRVVVFDCLGISKGFKDGVSLQQLLLQLPLVEMKRTEKQHIKYTFHFPMNTAIKSGWFSAMDSVLTKWVIHCDAS